MIDYKALEANYRPSASNPFQNQAQQKVEEKKGGGLLSLLPSAAAAAASFIPGVGTIAGGLIGGAGEAGRQLLSGEKFDLGKVGTEAALSAVPFGLGKAGKIVKGVSGAVKAGEGVAGAAKAAGTAIAPITAARNAANTSGAVNTLNNVRTADAASSVAPSLLDKLSRSATKAGSGLKTGKNVGDINRLDDSVELFQRRKISGTPDQQLRRIDEEMAKAGSQVDDILSKTPIKLDGNQVRAQVQAAVDDPLKYADVDLSTGNAQKYLQGHLTKFAESGGAKPLNDYVKTLNPVAIRARDKIARGVTPTDKEVAALVAKRAGDEVLSQVPAIAPLKRDMAMLFERNPEVAKLAEQKTSATILGTTIPSRAVKQGMAGVQSALGQAATSPKAASLLNKVKIGGKFGVELGKQGLTRAVAAPLAYPGDTSSGEEAANPLANAPGLASAPQATQNDGITQQQLMAAVAADPKNADTYITLYKLFNDSSTKKPLSAEASRTISNAQAGLANLDTIERQLSADPSLQQRGGISSTFNPFGLTSGALGTGEYENAREQARDVIGRIRTGATLTKEESMAFDKFLPQPGDSQATVKQKLQTLRNQFQFINESTGGAGTDLAQTIGG